MALTKSELIDRIADRQTQLSPKDVELAVKTLIEQMADSLSGAVVLKSAASAVFPSISAPRAWAAIPRPVPASSCTANMFPTSNPVKSCANALMILCMQRKTKTRIMKQKTVVRWLPASS